MSQVSGEEQERRIMGYEEAMHKIKEATGVSDIQVGKVQVWLYSKCFSGRDMLLKF